MGNTKDQILISASVNLAFRPKTYFPESPTREQLLARIKGQSRREMARGILETEGIAGLSDFVAREELNDHDRDMWGLVHPHMMGGEYLPGLRPEEVEIARISLKSTTFDQKSIRARPEGDRIRLSVEDEYETEYELPFTLIAQPLSLGELIEFLGASRHPDDVYHGGMIESDWNFCEENGDPLDECVDFATVSSGFYPQLSSYFNEYGLSWMESMAEKRLWN